MKTDWVKCPICGEEDMRKETVTEEGHSLISCCNHACASNGGNNALELTGRMAGEDGLGLTPEEHEIMQHLIKAWNKFNRLDPQHGDDKEEFRHSIHRLQHLLMIRPTRRNYKGYHLNERSEDQ